MTREEFEKKDWYMIQYKNPKTKRWNDYAGLFTKILAERNLKHCKENSLLEWRIKKHEIVIKY